ncbi:PAS domain S-box-containing protein [Halogranum amylolyticum]|uniref:histidine kinase n=1 Tax=Halogranum amylolyticum TaxID=660520 RepID=A0A1H8QMS3_9EURY|nr:PAS domain S-box-containing protein [Halogranum amylolyticum]
MQRVNSTFEQVFGYAADDVVGENVDEFIVPPERDAEAAAFNETLQAGTNLRAEVQRATATGVRDFLLHVVPIRLDETNAGGYAIYTDVTDQRERERELRRQNERLDEFASIVSHDLRNPLTVASGYLDLARETNDDANLEKVDAALGRMERLVENLLRLARKGQIVGETTPVELRTVATEAWGHVETADVELVLSLPTDETIDADYDRLVDLLENLFRNSVEHGVRPASGRSASGDSVKRSFTSSRAEPDDSVEHGSTNNRTESGDSVEHGSTDGRTESADAATDGEVTTVRVETTDGGFAVEDDGPGIPEGDRESVFEIGYTTDDDGTGFGLAIVPRIAEAHGWSVAVTAGVDGGARFEFSV